MFEIIEKNRYPGLALEYTAEQILVANQTWEATLVKWETIRDT